MGRANFTYGPDLKTLLTALAQKGYSRFIIDLSDCALMDSTLLGILAGFGLKMAHDSANQPAVELLNTNSRITELLENLGALNLFKLAQGSSPMIADAPAETPAPVNPSREQITRTCLEAHQSLIEMNPGNAARFKDVTRFLAEDLNKQKKQP